MGKWIGVDLDGTLARSSLGIRSHIGEPIMPMLYRIKDWLRDGKEVRLFTARASDPAQLPKVREWLKRHGLEQMAITNVKDLDMEALYDDKAIRVERNTGRLCSGCFKSMRS